MLFTRTKQYSDIIPPIDIKKLIFVAKKILPDIIFNMGSLEGNPFTFPEVQTLLDGITVGGRRVSDEQQLYGLKNSWECLFDLVKKEKFQLNKEIFNSINNKVTINEVLISGEFRDSQVRIGGTDYIPPQAEELNSIFLNELPKIIGRCKTKTELAFEIFLFVALNQFYYDGNKRTGRLLANGVLLSSGQGVLNVKAKDKLEFNTLMIDFYDTKNANNICDFLYSKCLER
ncbi:MULTISPECIES: Fic family protein [Clostridium]|uniref:Fic family protein n=1 Tax=Clostridium TaxID=1485 RepID=UPI00090C55AE|nr:MULTISPECIES: Fic family protein [Clostridium]APF25254.1 fic/DOC family protein [Clostridium sporogenes]MBD5640032.1 Fic family protein [Clostridium botulinum]MDI6918926.1 Fic family protein [Clostridium botulinum]WMU99552.1 Fic family protein [Clostridium botulinum]